MQRHRHPLDPRRARSRSFVHRALVVAALAAIGAVAAPQEASVAAGGPHATRTLFADHFSRTPDPAWTFVNRDGRIADGVLSIDGGYLDGAIDRDGWALTRAGTHRWRDYVMTARFAADSTGTAGPNMAMFYVRVGETRDTSYRILVWDPGQPDPRGTTPWLDRGLVQLMRVVDGEYTMLQEVERSNTTAGWNRIRIAAIGSRITVHVNGSWIFTTRDPAPIRSGGVGVGQIWETNGIFDDVVVRAVCTR